MLHCKKIIELESESKKKFTHIVLTQVDKTKLSNQYVHLQEKFGIAPTA